MPSPTTQQKKNMIHAMVRDNPGKTSKEIIPLLPIAPHTARVCITEMIKDRVILMGKDGTNRPLYTPEHVEENNIDLDEPKPPKGNKLLEIPVESIGDQQRFFNSLWVASV